MVRYRTLTQAYMDFVYGPVMGLPYPLTSEQERHVRWRKAWAEIAVPGCITG